MATKETAPAASGLTFTTVDVPAVARAAADNPFTAAVAGLTVGGAAAATSLTYTGDAAKATAKIRRLLQAAGIAAGVTVRSKIDVVNATTLTVTLWAVPKITRKAK